MTLTKRYLNHLRATNFICAKLTDEQVEKLLSIFGKEPDPDPPFVWDEEHIWITIRKMARY